MCTHYMNENYKTANQNNTVTRNFSLQILQPLKTKALSQKCLYYLGPFIWNALPDVKLSKNVNTFKHKVKKKLLDIIKRKKNQDIYGYYG